MNCPNCGAIVTGDVCEFCGSVFYNFVDMDPAKPLYIKIRNGNEILYCRAALTHSSMTIKQDTIDTFWANDEKRSVIIENSITIDAEFTVLHDDPKNIRNMANRIDEVKK